MRFTWTTIRVRDLDKSLAFYHDLLGLPMQERFGPPGHEIAMLGPREGTKLELLCGGEPCRIPGPLPFHGLCRKIWGSCWRIWRKRDAIPQPMSLQQ